MEKGRTNRPVPRDHHPDPHTTTVALHTREGALQEGTCPPSLMTPVPSILPTAQFWATYIHGNTPDTWPTIPLCLILMIGTTSLQDRLVNAATSSYHTFWGRSCTLEGCITPSIALQDPPIRHSIPCWVLASAPPMHSVLLPPSFLSSTGSQHIWNTCLDPSFSKEALPFHWV